MKKLEKYKIVPQAKFVKFKVNDFVEIPAIRHKAVPPPAWLPKIIFPPWMCPHPGSWSLAVAPLPGWWHKNHFPPLIPDTMRYRRILFEYQGRIFHFSFSNVSHISLSFITWNLIEHLHTQDFQRAMAHLNFWTNTLLNNFSENSTHSI